MLPVLIDNPPNPWSESAVEYIDAPPPRMKLEVYRDASRAIITRNDSPDVGFEYSVNPYRGCLHACAYCYARPGHEYLGFGAGTDFDRRIVVKLEAPRLLREALAARARRPSKALGSPGDPLAFSGVTDCYQPLEASYRLTRGCLEACADHATPVGIITKSALIERDIDVLVRLRERAGVNVTISIPFRDADLARAIEPLTPSPERRLRTISRLAAVGIPVSVNVAPIIPGLNDSDIAWILQAAHAAGATGAGYVLLRLPGNVATVFEQRLRAAVPLRADRVLSLIKQTRGGALYDARFGERGRGNGPVADNIRALFHRTAVRLGLRPAPGALDAGAPPRPAAPAPPADEVARRPRQLRLIE